MQALIENIKEVLQEYKEHGGIGYDESVYRTALSALTAEPEYNTSNEGGEIFLEVSKAEYDRCHEDYRWISYPAPPAQLLRPVELPRLSDLIDSSESMPSVRDVAIWDSAVAKCAELLRQQGYEVKS